MNSEYIFSKFGTLMMAALSLIVALAWNDAITNTINTIWSEDERNKIISKFLYAVIITFMSIFVPILVLWIKKKL